MPKTSLPATRRSPRVCVCVGRYTWPWQKHSLCLQSSRHCSVFRWTQGNAEGPIATYIPQPYLQCCRNSFQNRGGILAEVETGLAGAACAGLGGGGSCRQTLSAWAAGLQRAPLPWAGRCRRSGGCAACPPPRPESDAKYSEYWQRARLL